MLFRSPTTSSQVPNWNAANTAMLYGVTLPVPVTASQVRFYVVTADTGGCNYDFGLINGSGTLVWHTGRQSASGLGLTSTGWVLRTFASQTIPAGKYYVGLTTDVASGTNCAKIAGSSSTAATWYGTSAGIASGGTLANMTAPADIPTMTYIPMLMFEP